MGSDINVFLAFGAGFLSFISPCTLPLYPAFLSYITGMTLDELKSEKGMLQKTCHFPHIILFTRIFNYLYHYWTKRFICGGVFPKLSNFITTGWRYFNCSIRFNDCRIIASRLLNEGSKVPI